MKRPLIVLVAVAAALFLTNPERSDLEDYLETRIEKDADYETTAGEIFGGLLTDGLATLMAKSADRQDYLLFSTYKIGDDTRLLGLLGTFFQL
jgi:hypothetical protein